MSLRIPIGIDDFKEVIEKDLTYVDKTHFIEEVIQNTAKVQLILRPRRFGKTLNLSTLNYFFDHKEDHRHLFKGLYIETQPCFQQCGSAPVIFMTFKDLKADDFETFLNRFANLLAQLYRQHKYLEPHLDAYEKADFQLIASKQGTKGDLLDGLSNLMTLLFGHHKQRLILLIDEYDSPIHAAHSHGYYDEAIGFMRSVLSSALKGHPALEKSVMTGILQISKESIFSGLNHVESASLLDPIFATTFGFSETEVTELLALAHMEDRIKGLRHWYNGYRINGHIIYNPWSVLSFLKNHGQFQPYWVNTSSNDLIRTLLCEASPETQALLTRLMEGHTIEALPETNLSFRDIDGRSLWTLLLYSGYLTIAKSPDHHNSASQHFRIPNQEVLSLYQETFIDWFQKDLTPLNMPQLLKALLDGDIETFAHDLSLLIQTVLSYYDTSGATSERVYHAFILGILSHLRESYRVLSNRESGLGRYDAMMIPKHKNEPGFIFEFKLAKRTDELSDALQTGAAQIRTKNYRRELEDQGIETIRELVIAFCGKNVRVLSLEQH